MSCYACGETFGLFSKEHGCKNCGFAFCSRCIPKKIAIPKLNNEKHRACQKCYDILSGKVKEAAPTAKYSPPENFKKRVAALKEREASKNQHPQSSNNASGHVVKPQYRGLSKAEREIAERLDKLKEKTPEEAAKSKVSQKEIEDRLSRLKGEEPSSQQTQQKKFYHPPDRRSQQAQIDDLLDEIADEVELDSKLPDPVTQIENRLSKLKGEEPSSTGSASNVNNNDLNFNQAASAKPFTQNISAGDKGNNSGSTDDKITLEEMQKLIAQAAQEVEMDAQKAMEDLQKDKEIMKRLQEIKSCKKDDVNKDHSNTDGNEESDSDNEDEEKLTKNLIKQLLEESRLEDAAIRKEIKEDNVNSPQQTIDPDELPYCSICTEDATVRCHGCDLDLFCRRCWNHCHKEFGMEDHATSKYVMPKETE